jgi:phosphomannomutase
MMQKHVFFDLDNTLTPSRALMLEAHRPTFDELCRRCDVIVVTGGAEEQIRKQIPFEPTDRFFMLSQQGNFAVHKNGERLWQEMVTQEQEKIVRPFARSLTEDYLKETGKTLADENDIFENRGSQFASSIVGFHAPNEVKYATDPDQSIRRRLLLNRMAEVRSLHDIGIDVMPAGTTTFDFILRGKHKGFNISRLLKRENWAVSDCVYFGDALFPGGNDETVIGVIPTKPVGNPDATFIFIKEMLSS